MSEPTTQLTTLVEVRCPIGPRKLFTKLKLGQETGRYLQPENWIEFSCGDCSRRIAREYPGSLRVLHRYNFGGDLIETVVEPRTDASPDTAR